MSDMQKMSREPSSDLGVRIRRMASTGLFLMGVGCLVVLMHPSWGPWTKLAAAPLVIVIVVIVLIVGLKVAWIHRKKRTKRLADGLAPLFGQGWDQNRDLKASKFSEGRPQRLRIEYPDSIPDHEPEWRRRVEDMARNRMEAEDIKASWDLRHGRVIFEAVQDTQERETKQAEQRVHDLLRPMFGTKLKISVTDWQYPEEETN